jgi:hypothetical protein
MKCQLMRPAQQKEPMIPFEIPPAPGLVYHSDYFEWQGKEYVFFTDGFSGWTELYRAKSRTPADLIRVTRLQMMRQGIPRQVHADQGSTYNAQEYKEFCVKWGVNLTMGSPKHPKGNSIAEAMVKKIKHVLKGASDEDEIVQAFLALNQTPLAPGRPSPAELHFGRNLRDEMHGKVVQCQNDWTQIREWKTAQKAHSKDKYDRHAKELSDLEVGKDVLVQGESGWRQATVLEKIQTRPRSYRLKMKDTGREIERNRVLLRPVHGEGNEVLSRVSPHDLFQQEAPPFERGKRWTGVIALDTVSSGTNHDPEPTPTTSHNQSPPPPVPIPTNATSDEAPGPSHSTTTTIPTNSTAPKKKKKEYIPVPATSSGRTVKKPEVMDL